MKRKHFPIVLKDKELVDLVHQTDKKTLAVWAIDCALRVLPYFEKSYPEDKRPRHALEALQTWIETGIFKMSVIRKASLDSHKAAREVGEDNPARSVARACGQAVATAHVLTHSLGSAIYSQQAIHRMNNPQDADAAVVRERDWQYNHLLKLHKKAAK